VNCSINFENTSSARDAQGNSVYNHCDGAETGKTNRATFDIAGQTLADVYAQVRAAGFTNLTIADTAVLGSATFPTDAKLFYQTSTPLTEAISYYPGSGNPVGLSNVVRSTAPRSRPVVMPVRRRLAWAATRPSSRPPMAPTAPRWRA
jgi:hypothetical protein